VPQFASGDNVQFAKDMLKRHGLTDKETVYDPVEDRHIPGVFVGRSYIHKLFKNTETNFSARGVAGYDVTTWYGLAFPAGTPATIVERMNQAVRQASVS
jgi:hypothetical protein